MGRQGGIARFTGTVGDLTYYFDDDKGKVKWKSRLNRKKWLARREMWRQHNSSRLFGAAAVVASNLWRGMPAGIRRLADGSGYGRLVGRCVSLMGDDGQLWDADLLKGLELNALAVSPSANFRLRENGAGAGIRLEGLDRLAAELDLAAGDSAGAKPATFLVAHGLSKRFGFGMNGMKLTAEEARVKTAFREGGERNGLSLSSGPECEGARGASRRFRVWVYGVKVADTLWNEAQETFTIDAWKGVGGCGYVTDWEQDFPNSLDLRNPFEGEKMGWDGEYVVYCALEVAEKRGRHWVRLPYCCKFRVVDVVAVENGELVSERDAIGDLEDSEVLELCSAMVDAAWKKERSLHFSREVLIEFKGHRTPWLDILRGFDQFGRHPTVYQRPIRGSGIARSLFSKAFAMAEAIASANSGLWPPFARSLFSKAFAMAEAVRAGP